MSVNWFSRRCILPIEGVRRRGTSVAAGRGE